MSILRLLCNGVVVFCWLFINLAIRMLITGEVFVIGIILPFHAHIGTTMGPHVQYVFLHRGLFLFLVPFFNAAVGFILAIAMRRARVNNRDFRLGDCSLALFFANCVILLGASTIWPESVVVEPVFAVLAGIILSGVTVGVNMAFASSPFSEKPRLD